MSTIVTRSGKGSPLTNNEVDANFTNLNTDKAELSGATFTGEIVANAGIALGDNDKATFGASDDLQIYHDGSNSYIRDTGTGNLNISADQLRVLNAGNNEIKAGFTTDGAVDLYHNNALKLATTSTGIDVTGTATMDGLTVDGTVNINDAVPILRLDSPAVAWSGGEDLGGIDWYTKDPSSIGPTVMARIYSESSGTNTLPQPNMIFQTSVSSGSLTDRMKIAPNGDISFYEDTGTTPKLFWDASAESLGIGTSSPNISSFNTALTIDGAESGLELVDSGTVRGLVSSNSKGLGLSGIGSRGIRLFTSASGATTERMRIDSSGGVLVGTTALPTDNNNSLGFGVTSSGEVRASVNNGNAAMFKRATSDGDIVEFRKDSTTVGSIGAQSGRLTVGSNSASGVRFDGTQLVPMSGASISDNTITLGDAGFRFKDLYLSGASYIPDVRSTGIQYFTHTTDVRFRNSTGSERMRIDSSGNIQQGNYSDTTIKNFNMRSTKAIFNIAVDGATDGAGTTLNYSWANGGQGPLKFSDASGERMRIASNGDLLVNTTASGVWGNATQSVNDNGHSLRNDGIQGSAAYKASANVGYVQYLNRTGSDGGIAAFYKNGTSVGSIGTEGGDLTIGNADTGLQFVNTSQIIRPQNLTTNTAVDAQVSLGQSAYRFKDLYLSGQVTSNAGNNTIRASFQVSGTQYGYINVTTGGTLYSTSSDYRLKENVVPLTNATARLKQLNPLRFSFIPDETKKIVDGFLAHEVQDVVPEAIAGSKDAMKDEEYEVTPAVLDDDGNVVTEAVMGTRSVPDYQGIDQSKLVPLLVATIQELEARITQLENN